MGSRIDSLKTLSLSFIICFLSADFAMPTIRHFACAQHLETGCVLQHKKLSFAQSQFDQPMIVRVLHGRKTLRYAGGELTATTGQWLLIAGGQSFDVLNEPDAAQGYRTEWLMLGDEWAAQFFAQHPARETLDLARVLRPDAAWNEALSRVLQGVQARLPETVLAARTMELLAWLAQAGTVFNPHSAQPVSKQIRQLIAQDMAASWQIADVAQRLGMSEATLRRRLANEGASFRELLGNIKMMRALTLLQTSPLGVAQVAYAVGYESPARFAAKFRAHFGCTPSDVRKAA